MRIRRLLSLFLLVLLCTPVVSQKTMVYVHEDADFKEAYSLFEKEKYGAAQPLFLRAAARYPEPWNCVRIEADYYAAVCAVELFNKDAEWLLEKFISEHPESPLRIQAYFQLGRYNFRKKKYKDVLQWLLKVDLLDLQPSEQEEYQFKSGYSYFETGDLNNARKVLAEIRNNDSKYGPPANYYHSHILYTEKNYESALMGFRKLSKDPNFGPIVPYYISHILFLQGKYDEVVVYAPPLLKDTANSGRTPEILKIIGESFFRTKDYQEAAPYLEKYKEVHGVLNRSEWYQLGFCYYKSSRYKDAVNCFIQSVDKEDSISQNACYHLGDCYVKLNDKQKANDAFFLAYKSGKDEKIREDALFNHAKLSFELAYNPFNESIKAFETYIKDYPNSSRKDEAFGYLVNVYYNIKNYEAALKSMEQIKVMAPDMKGAYQKIAYLRGVQLYNDQQFQMALDHFSKSLSYPIDKNYNALARYWKANATFLMGEKSRNTPVLDDAIKQFKEFQFETGASNTPYFNTVNYDLAYCYFRKSDWENALSSFRKYLTTKPSGDNSRLNDSYLRTADCYFKKGEHLLAAEYYEKSLEMNVAEIDYALYQRGLSLGFTGKADKKIESLRKLLDGYAGKSTYEAAGMYELAKAYALKSENDKALPLFKKIVTEHVNSSFVPPSMVQIGIILYQRKDYDGALKQMDLVIEKYPKTDVALEAILTITEICQNKGDMDCLDRLKKISWANISLAKLDSSAWELCISAYEQEKYDDAKRELSKYIQKYPDGIFILDGHFYKAECEYRTGDYTAALGGYQFVIDHLPSRHTNTSLQKAAWIHYKAGAYENALQIYAQLEPRTEQQSQLADARIGIMRCHFKLKDFDGAIEYARKVLSTDKIPKEVVPECHMTIAKSALEKQMPDMAWASFQDVIKSAQGERVAEAKYFMSFIKWQKGEYKESQKIAFELINSKAGYGYWNGKAFILISDDYVGLNDLHNAKITLKAFIEKSSNPELVAIAQEKLAKILEMEKELEEKNKKKEGEGMRILFNGQPEIPQAPQDSIQKQP